jgi:hypothetical protein
MGTEQSARTPGSKSDPDSRLPKPPQVQENWLAMIAGKPCLSLDEYPLLTDAHVTGQFSAGPYELINTAPIPEERVVKPAIILRLAEHVEPEIPSFKKTDTALFHGGSFPEEIAALMSLALGIRVRAGMASRTFRCNDPKGIPISWGPRKFRAELIDKSYRGWVLPSAALGQHPLSDLERIFNIQNLRSDTCAVLLRAARMYQEALWLTESATPIAWLLLVSAVETAASHFCNQETDTLSNLREWNPKLYHTIESGDETILQAVADQLHQISGSTRKFLEFTMRFRPAEPACRPPEKFRVAWADSDLKGALRKIYNYRSKALHGGTPFPFPICDPPFKLEDHWEAAAETPYGSVSALGAVWVEDDLPMMLHIFEYIVRSALIGWWELSLKAEKITDV